MILPMRPLRPFLRRLSLHRVLLPAWPRSAAIVSPSRRLHISGTRWAQETPAKDEEKVQPPVKDGSHPGVGKIWYENTPDFWTEFKSSYTAPPATFHLDIKQVPLSSMGSPVTVVGFLEKITPLSDHVCFVRIRGGSNWNFVQAVFRDPKLVQQLKIMRLNSPITVTGSLQQKRAPKNPKNIQNTSTPHPNIPLKEDHVYIDKVEIQASAFSCLNTFPNDLHVSKEHLFPPENRHLAIRYQTALRARLRLRSNVASFIRQDLKDFQEIETPVLFKSTPEGAREFLVPTRKAGYAYALPQSPQQYKQILMASGIYRYMQFARCFRDEDLRADRQPEFTQLDLEMAFTDGEGVMNRVEKLIKSVYTKFASPGTAITSPLPETPFLRMSYEDAMSKHGSDKPDLRIEPLIHRIDHIVPGNLKGMLTSIENPIIEACKIRLSGSSQVVQTFISNFLDSPDAEAFTKNPDGPPGVCVYDTKRPVQGLQVLGFEGAQSLQDFYENIPKLPYENKDSHDVARTFGTGDLLIIQARENLPYSGGSTMLGKLRLALYKAALEQRLIEKDPLHRFLWVTDFPMFTLDNGVDPGQGGAAGFSATHHPFTAPKTSADVDLLLVDPLKAKADHYDLVVNGVELGGGSRRIHSCEMQKFVMQEILKMSEERMNDFSHLFEALRAGCPPHAGLAIGFDRMIAVMTGRESVKDVIAFPKSSKAEDMMVRSPSRITDAELKSYHLRFADPAEELAAEEKEVSAVEEEQEQEVLSKPPPKTTKWDKWELYEREKM